MHDIFSNLVLDSRFSFLQKIEALKASWNVAVLSKNTEEKKLNNIRYWQGFGKFIWSILVVNSLPVSETVFLHCRIQWVQRSVICSVVQGHEVPKFIYIKTTNTKPFFLLNTTGPILIQQVSCFQKCWLIPRSKWWATLLPLFLTILLIFCSFSISNWI